MLDRRGADVVLWAKDGLLTDWLRDAEDWRIVMTDDDWIVACRSVGPVAERCSD